MESYTVYYRIDKGDNGDNGEGGEGEEWKVIRSLSLTAARRIRESFQVQSIDSFQEPENGVPLTTDYEDPIPIHSMPKFHDHIHTVELKLLDAALKETNGNQSLAAKLLGITRNTLANKLKGKKARAANA